MSTLRNIVILHIVRIGDIVMRNENEYFDCEYRSIKHSLYITL